MLVTITLTETEAQMVRSCVLTEAYEGDTPRERGEARRVADIIGAAIEASQDAASVAS
jgi:hypothetical protein